MVSVPVVLDVCVGAVLAFGVVEVVFIVDFANNVQRRELHIGSCFPVVHHFDEDSYKYSSHANENQFIGTPDLFILHKTSRSTNAHMSMGIRVAQDHSRVFGSMYDECIYCYCR